MKWENIRVFVIFRLSRDTTNTILYGTEWFVSFDKSPIQFVQFVYSSMIPSNISLHPTRMKALTHRDNCYIRSVYAPNDSVSIIFCCKSITQPLWFSVEKFVHTQSNKDIFTIFTEHLFL